MDRAARVLLIEDDDSGRELARFNLERAGYEVDVARDGEAGLAVFSPDRHDLVVTDLKMPGRSGLEVLAEVKARAADTPVIVVTAYANVERAVEAMKGGAQDFIGKPFNRDHLLLSVRKALERRALQREVRQLRIKAAGVERPLVFVSGAMREVVATIDRVAPSDATVLLAGESGTGKELLARRLHVKGARAEGPFVAVNCAAVPGELLESELFGHERGAFTGAAKARLGRFRQAEGGTLFLDEIAEMPLALQGKLLRVLQERAVDVIGRDAPVPVDVRVVAATNAELRRRVADGAFRQDLFYRLAVVELTVPPLRERPDDIAPLVEHLVARLAGGRELTVPDDLLAELASRPWPGNVRELENTCERLVLLAVGGELSSRDLPAHAGRWPEERAAASADEWPPLPEGGLSLVELERRVIERALELKGWNVSQTARYLGVPRHILTYRMVKHGIRRR